MANWRIPNVALWRGFVHANQGSDTVSHGIATNETTTIFTVPANHVYLIRNATAVIRSSAVVTTVGTARVRRSGGTLYMFATGAFPLGGGSYQIPHNFFYPLECVAGDILEVISTNAQMTVTLSVQYTDVDISKSPNIQW